MILLFKLKKVALRLSSKKKAVVFFGTSSLFVIFFFQNCGNSFNLLPGLSDSSRTFSSVSYKGAGQTITPFHQDDMEQVFVSSASSGQTGQWWCDNNFGKNLGGSWACFEVTGGGSCASDAPSGSMVSCLRRADKATVNASVGPVEGQTGQWWCDNHFGGSTGSDWLCLSVNDAASKCYSNVSNGDQITCARMYEMKKVTTSSGPVAGQTGDWWCKKNFGANLGGVWNCIGQTNPTSSSENSCAQDSNAGSVVSCEHLLFGNGNGDYLNPDTTCNRADLDKAEKDFCNLTSYTKQRQADSIYVMNRYVRAGINRRMGGTIFELYGTDFVNRLEEHGGSAMQLSLWGYDSAASGAAYFKTLTCDTTAFSSAEQCQAQNSGSSCITMPTSGWQISNCTTVTSCPGWSAAGPINPIQAQGQNCAWSDESAAVSSLSSVVDKNGSPGIAITRSSPFNYTKSSTVDGMAWSQTVTTPKDTPYAMVDYKVDYTGLSLSEHNQEMPAIFTDDSIGSHVYFYEGSSPYSDATGAVTSALNTEMDALMLPGRTGTVPLPAASKPRNLTEDWASFCDANDAKCVTVVTFASLAKQISTGGQYVTILGRFAMSQGFSAQWQVYIFPYRFDDVIEGKSVRQWIYELKQNQQTTTQTSTQTTTIDSASSSSTSQVSKSVIGTIDGIYGSPGSYSLNGWACETNNPSSIGIHMYLGGPAGSGTFVGNYWASNTSEQAVADACQSTGTTYRFSIPISDDVIATYSEQLIYIHGISPSGLNNELVYGSGTFSIPKKPAESSAAAVVTSEKAGPIQGVIDGVYGSPGSYTIGGWACAQNDPNSIAIHMYLGGPAGSGSLVGAYTASNGSEQAVADACHSTGTAHRFSIPITDDIIANYKGRSIYIHGISPNGLPNALIFNSGVFSIPY